MLARNAASASAAPAVDARGTEAPAKRPEIRANPLPAKDAPRPAPARSSANDQAALRAIAEAVAADVSHLMPQSPANYGDVMVRPIAQKPALFVESASNAPAEEAPPPEQFIPQAAERVPSRVPRMPKFEDLPMPAQAEIRHARGDAEDEHPQKGRLSLLQRLANVGLGRRDEEPETLVRSAPQVAQMPPLPERRPQRPAPQQVAADPVSEYARRNGNNGLDGHGRPMPQSQAPQGDDHLDIPAFLRRQSN
jgi:cell division protein FtsZ